MNELHAYLSALQPFTGEIEILFDEIMARHTTFRIGGPAKVFLSPKNIDALGHCIREAHRHGLPCMVIGNGSNLLVQDAGVDGVVVCTGQLRKVQAFGVQLRAEAGVLLSQLAKAALTNGLTGLEFAAGIPGSVGGAVFMNAGAYDGQMDQIVTEVHYLDENGERHVLAGDACGFAYRSSIFKEHSLWSIAEVVLTLREGNPEEVRAKMDDLAQRRRDKQPLEMPSAGSTFKRPAGHFAGALIEQAGLKGFSVGGAQVSEKHAGFVVNRGGATCADVQVLIETIRQKVQETSGVLLECEIRIL